MDSCSQVDIMQQRYGPSRVSSDAHYLQSLDDELQEYLPAPNSAEESSVLRRLRAMAARSAKYSESCCGIFESDEVEGPTELSWQGNQVIWRRSKHIIRTFSFDENITSACWAWMGENGPDRRRRSRSTRSRQAESTTTSDDPSEDASSFTGAQLAFRSELSGSKAAQYPNQIKHLKRGRQRALVVALHTILYILIPRLGSEYTVLKDFKLRKLIPAPSSGIFLQRYPETEDLQMALDSEDQPLPMLLYLGSPLEEMMPVPIVDTIPRNVQFNFRPSSAETYFSQLHESLIPISYKFMASHIKQPELLLTYDPRTGHLRIYGCATGHQNNIRNSTSTGAQSQDADMISDEQPRQVSRPSGTASAGGNAHPRPSLSRLDSASSTRGTEQATRARPSIPTRRSARLSTYGHRDASAPSKTPMLRRRSSRFASTSDKNANMARIDESFVQSGGNLPSTSALPPTEGSQRLGDAAEAEEMGQLVEGLARRPSDVPNAADATMAEQRLGAALELGRGNIAAAGSRRNQSMMRTPYAPASRAVSSSMHRRRSSRGGRGDMDLDPTSFFNTTNVTGVSLLATANGDETRDVTTATAAFASMHDGRASADVGSRHHTSFSRTAALELLDTIPCNIAEEDEGRIRAFVISRDPLGDGVYLYISLPGLLVVRTILISQGGSLAPSYRCQPTPIGATHGECICQSAIAVALAGPSEAGVLAIDDSGNLRLAIPRADGHSVMDVQVARSKNGFSLVIPAQDGDDTRVSLISLHSLASDMTAFTATTTDGEQIIVNSTTRPNDALIPTILTALDIVLDQTVHVALEWAQGRLEHPHLSEWQQLTDLICPRESRREGDAPSAWELLLSSDGHSSKPTATSEPAFAPSPLAPSENAVARILQTLDAIAQDVSLHSNAGKHCELHRLIDMLADRHDISGYSDVRPQDKSHRLPHRRPTLFVTLSAVLDGRVQNEQQVVDMLLPSLGLAVVEARVFLSRTLSVLRVFLPDQQFTKAPLPAMRAKTTLKRLSGNGFDEKNINLLPEAIVYLIKEALATNQANPGQDLTSRELKLIGREDLVRQFDRPSSAPRQRFSRNALRSLPRGALLDAMSAMLFREDQRLQDVVDMLMTARPTVVRAPNRSDKTDEENHREGLSRMQNIAEKIKATPIGRGMFLMLTKKFDPTLRWHTPRLNLKILLRPPQQYHYPEPRPDSAELDWPEFHNGVASALEMTKTQGKLNSIWYFSQGAGARTPRHAGLLLGLGLAGRFEEIGQVHAFRYLVDRHDLTSIGLLLGLACTFVGQGDQGVRSLLACHVKAFLPSGSANLAHSTLVQCAGLLGTGLLFLGSDVSHMTESLVDQIGQQYIETTNAQTFSREVYSLSAGLGAGLVMLGRGRRSGMATVRNKALLRKLEHYIEGPPEGLFDEPNNDSEWRVDRRITMAPAALAYGLIFLRSNDRNAAARLPLPASLSEVDGIRPHTLLMLSIARNLILWDNIAPTAQWVESTLPSFLKSLRPDHMSPSRIRAAKLASDHIFAGAYFAMSLKYAGSGNRAAKALLIDTYKSFDALSKSQSKQDYDGRILQTSSRAIADQLALCLSMVLAGSGDLDALKLLRIAHGQRPGHDPYGSHMATHMALGLLFLGGGRYTLGTSDASIAALLISLYPLFPTRANDNRAHLQAFRHLWFLAVEPRLAVAQDVTSGEVVYASVSCRDAIDQVRKTTLPSRLNDLHLIKSLSIDSDRYWPTTMEVSYTGDSAAAAAALGLTLYVKLRDGCQSYLDDPHGHKSRFMEIARRANVEMGVQAARALLDGQFHDGKGDEGPASLVSTLPSTLPNLIAAAHNAPWRVREIMWVARFADGDNTQIDQWRRRLRREAVEELQQNIEVAGAVGTQLRSRRPTSVPHIDVRAYVAIAVLTPPELDTWDLCEVADLMQSAKAKLGGEDAQTAADVVVRIARVAIRNMLKEVQGREIDDEVDSALLKIMAQ